MSMVTEFCGSGPILTMKKLVFNVRVVNRSRKEVDSVKILGHCLRYSSVVIMTGKSEVSIINNVRNKLNELHTCQRF